MPKVVLSLRQRIADVLMFGSACYLGLFGLAPFWFPFDIIAAFALIAIASVIGDYQRRWWPVAPYYEKEHQIVLTKQDVASSRKSKHSSNI